MSGYVGSVQKIVDNSGKLKERIELLLGRDVLIGVPKAKAARKPTPGEPNPPNNATLAYIHENGSPAQNIPARPFIRPGMRKARPQVIPLFRQAALLALGTGTEADIMRVYHRIGMIGRNSMVEAITSPSPPFVPLKPATIRGRLRRTQAGRRQLQRLQQQATRSGQTMNATLLTWASAATAGGGQNIQPLIDTGSLRSSLTYVIK
jgi:hypothetical protein